jgi:hypothetical protein
LGLNNLSGSILAVITGTAGKITGIFLNSVLDSIYLKLFQNSRRGARRNPLDIEHGIKLVIFGCFLLEAKVNEEIRYILSHENEEKKFVSTLWDALKKKNILDKIEIITSVSTKKQQAGISLLRPMLKDVFDLRNRLAHFKDEPRKHAKCATTEDALGFIRNLPVPEINQKLMWEKVKFHAETISNTSKWLNSFHRSYGIKKNIKSIKENIQ